MLHERGVEGVNETGKEVHQNHEELPLLVVDVALLDDVPLVLDDELTQILLNNINFFSMSQIFRVLIREVYRLIVILLPFRRWDQHLARDSSWRRLIDWNRRGSGNRGSYRLCAIFFILCRQFFLLWSFIISRLYRIISWVHLWPLTNFE